MATYTAPVLADFRTRFPEFANVADPLVQAALDEAARTTINDPGNDVTQNWCEGDYADATLYLAAHLLTINGEPKRSDLAAAAAAGGAAGTGAVGDVKKYKVGDVETEFFDPTSGTSTSTAISGDSNDLQDLSLTAYGRRYRALLKRNIPTIMVI